MNTSFIIDGDRPVARLGVPTLSRSCRYGFEKAKFINPNYEFHLVNARSGKISAADRWQDWERRNNCELPFAIKLNKFESDDQYLIES